mmetsp:Transcript_14313/g.33433  ORF Transcript_14313/g.33433 Transcript_14313/m.33433 type:complete len:350 (-) Transcript_14313:119-1168(-)
MAVGCAILALSVLVVVSGLPVDEPSAGERQNGINFLSGQWSPAPYDSPEAETSLTILRNTTETNYLSLSFAWFQPSVDVPGPIYRGPKTPTDQAIRTVVARARSLGMKAMLRPLVDPDWRNKGTHGTWRGQIGRNFTSAQWAVWFSSYRDMLLHYVQLGVDLQLEQLCIGGELIAASHQEDGWRKLVSEVRTLTHARLMYAANHGNELDVKWFDAVDVIGIDAYYPLAPSILTPTIDDLKQAWLPIVWSLGNLSKTTQRPIVFAEVGYCSANETNVDPAHCYETSQVDNPEAQVVAYEALFESFYPQDWFLGVYWWSWGADPTEGGSQDRSFTPKGKPASDVMKKWYTE